jgi:hypothetical protein
MIERFFFLKLEGLLAKQRKKQELGRGKPQINPLDFSFTTLAPQPRRPLFPFHKRRQFPLPPSPWILRRGLTSLAAA